MQRDKVAAHGTQHTSPSDTSNTRLIIRNGAILRILKAARARRQMALVVHPGGSKDHRDQSRCHAGCYKAVGYTRIKIAQSQAQDDK